MTINAVGTWCSWLVMMMIDRVIFSSRVLMAGRAELIVIELKFVRMWIVTIRAANAVVIHFALNERTVNVVFITNLPVHVVNRIHDELGRKIVIEVTARLKTFGDYGAARMTWSTSLNLRKIAFRFKFCQSEPVIAIPKQTFSIGQFNVITPRTMTGFATHVDF